MSLRGKIVRVLHPVLKPVSRIYLRKERSWSYGDLKFKVLPGIFHPGLFISTRILMDMLKVMEVKGRTVLELGCGSGAISVLAASKGALVTASDIDPKAIENTELNASKNRVEIETIKSDLLDSISREFDVIFINPPYYPKDPSRPEEVAFYCGTDHVYFKRLFQQLAERITSVSQVFMILSEDCRIDRIKEIALENGLEVSLYMERRVLGENNFVFRIENRKEQSTPPETSK